MPLASWQQVNCPYHPYLKDSYDVPVQLQQTGLVLVWCPLMTLVAVGMLLVHRMPMLIYTWPDCCWQCCTVLFLYLSYVLDPLLVAELSKTQLCSCQCLFCCRPVQGAVLVLFAWTACLVKGQSLDFEIGWLLVTAPGQV